MKKIQNTAAFLFIICVVFLAIMSILGVWNILGEDVIVKSIKTIGLLAGVAALIIIAGRFADSKSQPVSSDPNLTNPVPEEDINTSFTSIRHGTIVMLIASSVVLAFLGVMAIWDVASGEVLSKSLASLAIVTFASLIIVFTCLEREHHKLMKSRVSGSMIFIVVIVAWVLLRMLSRTFW